MAFLVFALRDADPNPYGNQRGHHDWHDVFRWRRYDRRRFERHTEVRSEKRCRNGIKGQQTSQPSCDKATLHDPSPPFCSIG